MVIAAALVGVTAAGAATRIPGTTLRFGAPIASLDTSFAAMPATADTTADVRRGSLSFFGIPATATLTYRAGRLAGAEFDADSTSSAARAYMEDELAREGYRRRCARWDDEVHACDWSGPAELHLESSRTALRATAHEAAPRPVVADRPGAADTRSAPALPGRIGGAAEADTARPGVAPAPADSSRARAIDAGPPPLDTEAQVLDSCLAVRPEAARRAGIFGTVMVKVAADTSGTVVSAIVVRGIPELDRAALACAHRYRFLPPVRGGRRQAFERLIAIRFAR
jgi:TonB family protein